MSNSVIESPKFNEVGILEHDGAVVCREYMVEKSGTLFDLTAGTQGYVESLVSLNPEFATEPILIVDGAILAEPQKAVEHITLVPELERYLIEQTPPTQE